MTSEPPPDEQAADRPWPAPGPDAGWWHGAPVDSVNMPSVRQPALPAGPVEPLSPAGTLTGPAHEEQPAGGRHPRRTGPRHRERRALTASPAAAGPALDGEPVPAKATAVTAEPVVDAAVAPAIPPPPIWEPIVAAEDEDDRREWPVRTLRAMRAGHRPSQRSAPTGRPGARKARRRRDTRRPVPGLIALVVLALLAAFFAWFSAQPLWLSLGHGTRGVATVVSCPVHGIAKRCADFTADGDAFVAGKVTLLGGEAVRTGGTVPARMVSATSGAAYVGDTTARWVPSLLAVLLCGLAIGWLCGAFRLADRRSRWVAFGLGVAGPILLTIGMLAAAW